MHHIFFFPQAKKPKQTENKCMKKDSEDVGLKKNGWQTVRVNQLMLLLNEVAVRP